MTHAAPPTMNLYRARPLEVRAIDCGDGRHVLLTDPPRYVESVEFAAGFELVEEQRVVERRQTNGRGPKVKQERRKGAGRRHANGTNPIKVEAQRLFEAEGKGVNEIRKQFKLSYSTVFSWSKKWKQGKSHGRARQSAEPAPNLASAIAARTEHEASAPRPRGRAHVDQVIEEVRGQVDRERSQRDRGLPLAPGEDRRTGRELRAGESIGTGRKACPKCHMLNSSYAQECGSCGHVFLKKER